MTRGSLPAKELPPDVKAFNYVPYSAAMPRAACIVHQRGIGTVAQALSSKRPMLAMLFGHDTLDNTRRCAEWGAARVLSQRRFGAASLASALSELPNNPEYARRAQVMGEKVRAEKGTKTACDVIERL